MKLTGKLLPPVIDYLTGRLTVLFAPNEDFSQGYEELKDKELTVEIKPYKRKRTLDANAYYWVLITKLAKVLETSNTELHNKMIVRYGQFETIKGQLVQVRILDSEENQKIVENSALYHLCSTTQVDDCNMRIYYLMRGSSTYNTEEMARLINGLISECRDAEIPDVEIATPDEKRILKEKYNIDLEGTK